LDRIQGERVNQIRQKESPREDVREHRFSDTALTALALLGGIGAAVALLVVYWTTSDTAALGASLAASLGCIGGGLVFWSHHLVRHEPVSGVRERLESGKSERQAFLEDFMAGERDIGRRKLLGWLSAAAVGLLGIGSISLLRSLGKAPFPELLHTAWGKGKRLVTYDGKPVSAAALEPGDVLAVFPEGYTHVVASQTLLIRVEEGVLRLPADRAGWTPMGYVAYSRVCTHAGCTVGLYEADKHLLLCPCHQSTFDVLHAATPTAGPAARPLPQLPLYIDDQGMLRAMGDFAHPPGPGFWGIS
jgi:ubiquinol-cytochrome c reductase iron-sulfur subunit